ncbi:hypothetical protein DCS_07082 [Drechmeria coniospora]|uniref:Uncharacterized protein n=1 Tax=Drechmeria coniospora TaxID=98403 RepID=A0A151GDF5_DRECN|nr:hypothetical protein DCS_07082 [Drechmeria coniospora]KYK55120.1 hypothetical protein DCS_07082 [Drechmeria coniospora]
MIHSNNTSPKGACDRVQVLRDRVRFHAYFGRHLEDLVNSHSGINEQTNRSGESRPADLPQPVATNES